MRNAFVVLVSLCIGLVTGFILPSSVTEQTSQVRIPNTDATRMIEIIKSTTLPTKLLILPKNRSNIDEKDLYEHATEKENNQNERAFIYINQKYKKPVRSKVKMTPMDKTELTRIVTKAPAPAPIIELQLSPCPGSRPNSYFQGFDFSDKQPQDLQASYFAAPNIFRCNFNTVPKKENPKPKVQASTPNRIDERREYLELLKPPLLRPVSRINSKANYRGVRPNETGPRSPSGITYKENYHKKYNMKNQILSKAKAAITQQDEGRKKYGFDSAFVRRPFETKHMISRVEDVNFEGDFVNEEERNNDPEEDKLLDKYLKDTLEDQINDKSNVNMPECSYRECVLQTTKQYSSNGLFIKHDCKCGRRMNIKNFDPFLAKDRSLREETKRNDTALMSSEVNYYEEMLSDDSNTMKLEDDVVRPPSKTNDTSAP